MPAVTPSPTRRYPRPKVEFAPPLAGRGGKVISLLIVLEALRQNSYALGAHKV